MNQQPEANIIDNECSLDKGFIKGHYLNDNISILNVIYIRARKDPETEKYGDDYIYIIYRDLDTNEKKFQLIKGPKYRYYMTNPGVPVSYNKLFIEKYNVHPIECKYRDLRRSIAEVTNNKEWFIDQLKNGNYRGTEALLTIPSIFGADINIEDFYRFEFNKCYQNNTYTPTKLYFDIEVDGINMRGDFPEPGECPVNAVTVVDDANYKAYTLLLLNYNNPLIEEFAKNPNNEKDLKAFVQTHVGGWKAEKRFGLDKFTYKIVYYDQEIELIKAVFKLINYIQPDYALAWNMSFDIPYLIQRIAVLGYNPADVICDPSFEVKECYYFIDHRADKFEERGDYAQITCKTIYMDQLIAFASRRKGQRQIGSFKLDTIGELVAHVHKLDYSNITTNIVKLPYIDYHTFVFYNVADVIVQLCIEHTVNDVDFVHNKALTTNTRIAKVHRQTTYLVNRGIQDFYDMGYILGPNINKQNEKEGFAGAYVADPTKVSDKSKVKISGKAIDVLRNLDDFDYKALYPSIIHENNVAPNTMHGKVLFDQKLDPKENRFNNEYFDRSVWFIEDLVSHNYLDFCQRYLGMMSYEEMYHAIIRYFDNIAKYFVSLRYIDRSNGLRLMYDVVKDHKEKKRLMYELVDNSIGREMVIIQDQLPKKDDKEDDNTNSIN